MYTMQLNWKEFSVDIKSLDTWLKSNGQSYLGISANSSCEIHFASEPSDIIKSRIQQHWSSLNQTDEQGKIANREKLDRTVRHAKENLPYIDFAQMTVAEKKIFMGINLEQQDQEALVLKYPNV
jgi:hypothetical protein